MALDDIDVGSDKESMDNSEKEFKKNDNIARVRFVALVLGVLAFVGGFVILLSEFLSGVWTNVLLGSILFVFGLLLVLGIGYR